MSSRRDNTTRKRIDWAEAPVVHVVLPSCPTCGCLEWSHVKSLGNGDGTNTQRVLCEECQEPFKIVREAEPDQD